MYLGKSIGLVLRRGTTQNNINATALALVGHEGPGTKGTCTPSTCSTTRHWKEELVRKLAICDVFTATENIDKKSCICLTVGLV